MPLTEQDTDFATVISNTPESVRQNANIKFAMGRLYCAHGDFEKGVSLMEDALESNSRNTTFLKGVYASLLLDKCTNGQNTINILFYADKNGPDEVLSKCYDLLTETWEYAKKNDVTHLHSYSILNRGIVNMLLRKFKDAYGDLREAGQFPVNKNAGWNRNIILSAFEAGFKTEGIDLLNDLRDSFPNHAGSMLFYVEATFHWLKDRDLEGIEEVLQSLLEKDIDTRYQVLTLSLLATLYIKTNERLKAIEISNNLRITFPDKSLTYLTSIDVCKAFCLNEEIPEYLKLAKEYVDRESSTDLATIADTCHMLEDFNGAIEFYKLLNVPHSYDSLTFNLAYSYYRASNGTEALEICRKLRKNYGRYDPRFVRLESDLLQHTNDVESLQRLYQGYLLHYPEDQFVQFQLARINYVRRDKKLLKATLDTITSVDKLNLEQRFMLADFHVYMNSAKLGA